MPKNLKIGVVGIADGASTQTLLDRVEAATGHRCFIDMGAVTTDLARGTVTAGELDLTTLDAIIVKKIAAEYSPAVNDRLEQLASLRHRGVPIYSDPDRMLRLVNRLTNTLELAGAGIPMPPTVLTENLEAAMATVERFGAAVAKPLYTSKARGMTVLRPGPTLREDLVRYQADNSLIYLQQFMDLPGRDLGVVFLGGQYLACYARVSGGKSWNTTTRDGGHYEAAEPSDEIVDLGARAAAVFGLDFTCVDVVETELGPQVLEVSAFGGFRGLSEACGIDAAQRLVDYVIAERDRD
ncbi:MAG: GAK system ATP-grasp enzyme [Myxococcales bacterium FL481]|nr:MAG: GAK system ATP-grasp enzyme [Myxococcales bacterium FL481]